MKHGLPLIAALAATPVFAEDTRQLDAHEHGVGTLNIAFEQTTVTIEFFAPGADIVGFEYAAKSDADRAAIDNAVATLARPLDLFVVPATAGCSVTQASAELESEDEHDEHGHDAHEDEAHDHEEHAEHDDHAGHDDHAEHDHADGASHTEFHAEYTLTCAEPDAIDEITFAYFETFENARELEVQIVTRAGAQAFEIVRDAPTLDLRNLF
ncbi:MAG: DUF2796 domain-containing protein [Pseudomonadota bacterium]